jgi:SWI/SNF-related matrix-associated actin-dependent regulator of chromatin subfamily A3
LTGTPIQNTLYDLESLLRFLHVPGFEDKTSFRKHIIGKPKMKGGSWKPDYENLKQLLAIICLRRSTSVLALHGVEFKEYHPSLSEAERTVYNSLAESCRRHIEAAVSKKASQGQNQVVLTALLQLRMFCNSGKADITKPDPGTIAQKLDADETFSLLQQNGDTACVECGSEILSMEINGGYNQQITVCGSQLRCLECIPTDAKAPYIGRSNLEDNTDPSDNISGEKQMEVPNTMDFSQDDLSLCSENTAEDGGHPSKLKALLKDIKKHYYRDKRYSFDCVVKLSLTLSVSSSHRGNKA